MRQQQLLNCFGMAVVVSVLVAQPAFSQVVQVTNVQLNPTENGIEVILETPIGEQLQVLPRTDGNTYITDIPNAQLRLRGGNTFRQNNPIAGIAAVTVTNQAPNSIRVAVTGSSGVPTVELFDSDEGFIFSFTPAGANTQAEQQTETPNALEPGSETHQETTQPSAETPVKPEAVEPGNQTQPNETTAEGDEPIEIVVTATRTEEEVTNIPRSITVIDREEIEQQTRLSRNLTDILGFTVPGLSPSNQNINLFGQNLRGRSVSVLIDGVPQTTNLQTFNRDLRTIDPSAIERIEVIRGPSATYGSQGTGGVINIITRRPSESGLTRKLMWV